MMDIIHIREDDEAFQQFLTSRLRAFNDVHSAHHRAIRNADVPVVQLKVERDGQVIAGLFGSVYWGWFDLDRLWVDSNHAGERIGTRLLDEGERHARALGATQVKLTTFSFQAKAFYERFGYEVAGVLRDYPPGSDYYMMTKRLTDA
ncbi:GNAT family N-acetyltransferase [Exiguobacterium sp. SH3S2]|nr:GNAT family N-acetyltransferase [Exiguobacterium sp. SH3S3]TCI62513.1 GNAT family N-acetyltransferase [Exiguobacterium sp. SH3S2]